MDKKERSLKKDENIKYVYRIEHVSFSNYKCFSDSDFQTFKFSTNRYSRSKSTNELLIDNTFEDKIWNARKKVKYKKMSFVFGDNMSGKTSFIEVFHILKSIFKIENKVESIHENIGVFGFLPVTTNLTDLYDLLDLYDDSKPMIINVGLTIDGNYYEYNVEIKKENNQLITKQSYKITDQKTDELVELINNKTSDEKSPKTDSRQSTAFKKIFNSLTNISNDIYISWSDSLFKGKPCNVSLHETSKISQIKNILSYFENELYQSSYYCKLLLFSIRTMNEEIIDCFINNEDELILKNVKQKSINIKSFSDSLINFSLAYMQIWYLSIIKKERPMYFIADDFDREIKPKYIMKLANREIINSSKLQHFANDSVLFTEDKESDLLDNSNDLPKYVYNDVNLLFTSKNNEIGDSIPTDSIYFISKAKHIIARYSDLSKDTPLRRQEKFSNKAKALSAHLDADRREIPRVKDYKKKDWEFK